MVQDFFSITPDVGLESHVTFTQPVAARTMLPHFKDTPNIPDARSQIVFHDFEDDDDEQVKQQIKIEIKMACR